MQNKNIIIGITGGIAAYKTADLVRRLRGLGANVKVIMTHNATKFITPLTMQTLAENNVYTEMFPKNLTNDIEHIDLARWADAIVIAPASANFIAKLSYGFADDLLSTVCLATTMPVAIAPAMNKEMWESNITQKNIDSLKERKISIFGPASGKQACGEIGFGRMIEPQEIVNLMPNLFASKKFCGKKIVITAGPTREKIDPVRYVSNHSSGKMGYALAQAALEDGASVVLISGPTNLSCSKKVKLINVITAKEMFNTVMQEIKSADIFISAAAVADYKPTKTHTQKTKKTSNKITIDLEPNPDILANVAALKKRPVVVGFAAETQNLLANAKKKLTNKKLDVIIANRVWENIGFDNDENSVTVLTKKGKVTKFPKMDKYKLAKKLMGTIF